MKSNDLRPDTIITHLPPSPRTTIFESQHRPGSGNYKRAKVDSEWRGDAYEAIPSLHSTTQIHDTAVPDIGSHLRPGEYEFDHDTLGRYPDPFKIIDHLLSPRKIRRETLCRGCEGWKIEKRKDEKGKALPDTATPITPGLMIPKRPGAKSPIERCEGCWYALLDQRPGYKRPRFKPLPVREGPVKDPVKEQYQGRGLRPCVACGVVGEQDGGLCWDCREVKKVKGLTRVFK